MSASEGLYLGRGHCCSCCAFYGTCAAAQPMACSERTDVADALENENAISVPTAQPLTKRSTASIAAASKYIMTPRKMKNVGSLERE